MTALPVGSPVPQTSSQPSTSREPDKKDKDLWGKSETEYLLTKYEENLELFGPKQLHQTKKEMWDYLASLVNAKFSTNHTGKQCDNR